MESAPSFLSFFRSSLTAGSLPEPLYITPGIVAIVFALGEDFILPFLGPCAIIVIRNQGLLG